MVLNFDQIRALLRLLSITRDYELNCNEFLDKMAEFAELWLASKRIPDAFEPVKHHLSLCTECSEEYEALLRALKSIIKD